MNAFTALIRQSWKSFLDIIYPRTCVICHRALSEKEEHICISCRLLLPVIPADSHELEKLKSRFWGKVKLDNTLAFLRYEKNGPVQSILKSVKYYRNQELAVFMGQLMGASMSAGNFLSGDCIVPVPLHPKKEFSRGFNQSERIAQGLSEMTGIPCKPELVRRSVNTRTQTKLNREERWENVKSIFEITNPELIRGKQIILLDDVVTTGSTLESLALKLENYEPKGIKVLALAMAD